MKKELTDFEVHYVDGKYTVKINNEPVDLSNLISINVEMGIGYCRFEKVYSEYFNMGGGK